MGVGVMGVGVMGVGGAVRATWRSATASRAGRCATSSTVRRGSAASERTAAATAASLSPSRLAVGSSSRTSGRSVASSARASARRWRWPADRPVPPSPSGVSRPCGSRCTKSSACAPASAARSSASGASGRSSRTLSATVPAKSCGRCGTQAICRRQSARSSSSSRWGEPSAAVTRTDPASGRTKPSSTASSVLLPAPLAPVIASVSPGAMVRVHSHNARALPVVIGDCQVLGAIAAPASAGAGRVPAAGSGVWSTAKIWSAAARPSTLEW